MGTTARQWLALGAGIAILCAASSARASMPAGIAVYVKRVVFRRGPGGQSRVLIYGAFAGRRAHALRQTSRLVHRRVGYVYYYCPKGKQKVCKREWADLKKSIGKGTCRMFGALKPGNGSSAVSVHKVKSKAKNPTKYPIQMGVLKLDSGCQVLKRLAKKVH